MQVEFLIKNVCLKIKCLKYWPSASPEMYGPVLVSPGDEEELADYVIRKFSVQMVSLFWIILYLRCF